nr:EAL domain-containing protein [Bacilli bacterium]
MNRQPFAKSTHGMIERWRHLASPDFVGFINVWLSWFREYLQRDQLLVSRQEVWDTLREVACSYYQAIYLKEEQIDRELLSFHPLARMMVLSNLSLNDLMEITYYTKQYWYEKFRIFNINKLNDIKSDEFLCFLESRFQDDQMIFITTSEMIQNAYQQCALAEISQRSTFIQWRQKELDALAQLPGIVCVFLMRPKGNGQFTIELSAGEQAVKIREHLLAKPVRPTIESDATSGQALVAIAAREYRVLSSPDFVTRQGSQAWSDVAAMVGVQSALAIPLRLPLTGQMMVLMLYGQYTNQFESTWMKDFGQMVKRKWEANWYRNQPLKHQDAIYVEQAEYYREILFHGGLVMYCQPIVSMESGELVKVELLARLRLPDGELVAPGKFLPILTNDELDVLFQMGLSKAADYLVKWKSIGLEIDVTINLPPFTLTHPRCIDWIETVIHERKIDPKRITLEILETQEVHEETAQMLLFRLKKLGIRLALDDLGSGYSSILRLSRLPFDVVKIDQGLLSNIAEDPLAVLGLIYGLVQIAKALGKDVVVEGVEHIGVLEAIKFFKATMCQGYGVGRPMPFEEITSWSQNWTIPIFSDEIHTFTGALVFHWLLIQQEHPFLTISYEECPLQRFLVREGKTTEQEVKWHTELHQNINFQENLMKGLEYLLSYAIEELRQLKFH